MGEGFEGLAHYRHLVEDLGIRRIKFLFVDNTADSPLAKPELEKLSQELCEVFDHWLLHDRNRVRVTLFDTPVGQPLRPEGHPGPGDHGVCALERRADPHPG